MRHQGTLTVTVLMNFFFIALVHSFVIASGTKDEYCFCRDLLGHAVHDFVPNRQRHTIIFIFKCNKLCGFNEYSIRFSMTPFSNLTLESEVEKEEEEKEGQSVSEEEEIVIGFEDETVEQLEEVKESQSASEEEEILISFEDETVEQLEEEEEEEVVLISDEESEMASEDETEFLGDFSNTNHESNILYR